MKKSLIIVLVLTCLFGLVGCDPAVKTLYKDELLTNTTKIELVDYENENPELLNLSRKEKPRFDFNKATLIATLDETHFEALGDMRIFDFFDELDIDVEHDDEDEEDEFDDANVTLGGWATDCLEGEVEEGSSFDFRNLTVTVLSYDNNRIERLSIEVHEDEEEEEKED